MMINITDSTLKQLLLQHLLEQAEAGGLDELLANGVQPALIDDLRQRPSRDFFHASRFDGLAMTASIDTKALQTCLWRRDMARHEETLKEYFIRHDASSELMRTLFTLPKQELQRLRTELDMSKKGPTGRPRMPTSAIRDLIHQDWHAINQEHPNEPERHRLWMLHQKYQAFSITTLYGVTSEFHDFVKRPVPQPKVAASPEAGRPVA